MGDYNFRNIPTQLLNFKAIQISAGTNHTALIDTEHNLWMFGSNFVGELGLSPNIINKSNLPIPLKNFKVKQVSTGLEFTIFIDIDDNVWSFGYNRFGQLGIGYFYTRIKPILTNESTSILHLEAPQVSTDIPTPILGLKAQQVATGQFHTLLIDLDNNVWSFGHND